uniref:Si:ch1073-416d2.3 n=1 Tax=Tetraodon nigroviridis TaxID=99883 RepID=H3DJ13_TETNG
HRLHLPSATISDLSFKNVDFAMNLYRKISSFHDKNIFFSPLSISASFAALLMGSDGVTYEEILEGLNLHQLEQDGQPEVIPGLFKLLSDNITQNGSLQLEQGMALFINTDFMVEKTFNEQLKTFFDADIKSANFADSMGTVKLINEYFKSKTHDKISDVVSSVDSRTRKVSLCLLSFQIKMWTTLKLMTRSPQTGSSDRPKGYRKRRFSKDPALSPTFLDMSKASLIVVCEIDKVCVYVHSKLEVNLPKFKMEQSYRLHEILPDVGMASIFDNSANLTKLSKDQGLKVSEVLHKAVIEVDETGTIAAAVTAVGITPFSLPRTFFVNRPFFFFIYHEKTNCMLFMGRVIDPTKD